MKSKVSKIVAGLIALVLVVAIAVPIISLNSSAAFNKSQYQVTSEITDYDAMDMKTILASDESLTWVFAGDSITHNASWSQEMNGYAEWFEQYLYDVQRNNDSVINTAWGGADILDFQIADNTSGTNGTTEDPGMGIENFITKYSPDVVFIKLGMNDRDQTTANFKTRYENMLKSLYDISYNTNKKIPKVVVIAPTPVSAENVYNDMIDPEQNKGSNTAGDENYDSTLRVRNTLEDIVADCNKGGYKVLFSDFRSAFLQKAVEIGDDYHHLFFSDPSDGIIHPNAAGQYLMFNTLSETLGIRDEKMPIYQIAYEEFENSALYTGGSIEDNEMNLPAPTVEGVTPLASVDFNNSNGVFSNAGAQGIDLTSELTQSEAASLQDAFTVVIRAQFPEAHNNNQPVLFISSNGTDNWNNALSVGVPGDLAELYYTFRSGDKSQALKSGAIKVSGGTYDADNMWHTIVVSYNAGTVKYYKDGQLLTTAEGYGLIDGVTSIGSVFANSTNYKVQLGRYGFAEDATSYALNAKMDYWQFYGTALTDAQVIELSGSKSDYSAALTENSVWVVAGAEQMSGYEGPVANRSMLRLFDKALRGGSGKSSFRDIRVVSAAAPGNTPAYLDANYDAVIGEHITTAKAAQNKAVFMLLPEIPEVYDANYDASTIDEQVSAYKGYVESLIGKSAADVEILWTPLASGDATINGYLAKYAEAVREVAAANEGVLLFDAYAYMNTHMATNNTVARNWFDNNGYISPLGATDVTYGFINNVGNYYISTTEITGHNLRDASDIRTLKGNYIRDYYAAVASVSGEAVTLDVSAIVNAGYTLDTSSLALLPEAGTGNYHEDIVWLKDVASDLAYANNKFTFTAPCSDLDIAIYSKKDGKIYRFKDVDLTVDTDKVLDTTPNPTSAVLGTLEIVGVPAVDLAKGDTFDVTLYQYQKYPQVRATAQDGLKITVTYTDKDGKEVSEVVESGKNSGLIPEEVTSVKVTVSGTVSGSEAEKTYTLNLTRPDYPDIIITEVMQDGYWGYDVNNYDNYELVEIYNASGKDLNLLDYSIGYKKDYPTDLVTETNGEWPYYFTGNNQAFNGAATHTGVNQITKYSSYWINDEIVTEPTEVIFPADSTMVIWVKEASAELTFDTLRAALEENAFVHNQKTLTVNIDGTETAVVPAEEQLVVAEIPEGATKGGQSNRATVAAANSIKNFYIDNFGSVAADATTRGWLFVLGNDAQPATNGAISEAGNDIISASKFLRVGVDGAAPDRLSSVFSYNVDRGMSLVKGEASWDDQYNVGHTSDEQGYNNLTSFGAIEYWQKPFDLDDDKAPVIESKDAIYDVDADTAAVKLVISDDNDIRYIELNVKDADGKVITIKRDLVLENGVANGGLSKDITSYEYVYDVKGIGEDGALTFWGYVEDGNGNKTEFGDEEAEVSVCEKQFVTYKVEDIAEYLEKNTYPTLDGCIFAGWYTTKDIPTEVDKALEVAIQDSVPEGVTEVYALFIPEHVLSVKAQISSNLTDGNTDNDASGSIRFATTVDSYMYQQVGFEVSYLNGNGVLKKGTKVSNEVYERLYAVEQDGSKVTQLLTYTPSGEFCTDYSKYFRATTVKNVPITSFGTEFTVTPFWVTLDGAKVYGITTVKTIEQGLPKDIVYVSAADNAKDAAGYGTTANPYATLNYAISKVKPGGTVCIIGDYKVASDFVWKAHSKTVTITSANDETLDFTALTELRINDAVTFDAISLNLPATVYAEGYDLTIASSANVLNTNTTLYGGSKEFEVGKTNIKLYSGVYATIYGGGNKTNVAGNTNVTIGGNVNTGVKYTDHSVHNDVYGGSYNGTVHGDTNVTIGTEDTTDVDNAIVCMVYGGGRGTSAVVEGTTHVNLIAGKLMGIYGGSNEGTNADTQVVMTGGYVEQIFGGSYKNSMTGDTDVRVMGGEVKRRIYAGCYNNFVTDGLGGTWEDKKYHVTGHTSVAIGPDAVLSLDYTETVGFVPVKADTTLMAASRWSEAFTDETGVMIFTGDSYSSNSGKIGYKGATHSDYFSKTNYNYLVKANVGGDVYSVGDKLQIVPDTKNGYVSATVEVDGNVVHYTEGESLYALPATDKDIIVTFNKEKQSTAKYEARINGVAYYPTVEEAFGVATSNTTIELLKDTVDVASTLTVGAGENVTVKEAEDVNVTVSRADALVNGSVFDVDAGGTLTVEGITLDGRTPAEIADEIIDLASLTGSTASLINTAGEVHVNNVLAQYAVKTSGFGAVIYGENVITASATVDNSEFNYNKSADQGGAICMYDGSSDLKVSNSIFTNNESGNNGGAISAHADTTTVTNCKFTGNTSGKVGGAFYSGSSNAVTMTTTAGASVEALFSGNNAYEGGAVGIGSGSNEIIGYTFKNNTADNQGGALLNSASTYTLTSCYFEGNSAPWGGAILNYNSAKLILTTDENITVEPMFKANTTTGNGGAICVNSGSISVEGYTFDGNTADGNGGAIRFNNAAITAEFTDTSFVNNHADVRGGAIDNNSSNADTLFTFVSTDGTAKFDNNTTGGAGGALYNASKMNIVGYTFSNNTAGGIGGAINNANSAANATIVNTKFESNKATGTSYGGAIANTGSAKMELMATSEEFGVTEATLAVFEENISNNTATGFGGGAVYFGSGSFSVDGYAFNNNISHGDAGALCLRAASTVTNCTFDGNDADQVGGAIYCYAKATITGSTFTNNTAVGTTTVTKDGETTTTNTGGGAIHNTNGGTTIANSSFSGNTTEQSGGAIYTSANITISDSSFTSNKASQYAGAIRNEKGTTKVTDTTFTTNESPKNGGAINNSGTLTLIGTKDTALFDRNKITASGSYYGGAVYNDGAMTANKYIFTGNYGTYRGGAIGNYGKNPTITDCKFVGNYSANNGGAIYSGGSVTINVVATGTSELALFQGNYTTGGTGGGAISMGSGTLNLTGYKFDGNYALNGGAIYNSSNVKMTMTGIEGDTFGSLLTGNYATTGNGGAINLASGCMLTVQDYTFDKNETKVSQGGAIYANGATLNITDTKFTGNIAKTDGGAVYGAGSTTSIVRGTDNTKAIFDGNKANGGSIGGGAYAVGTGTLDIDGYTFKNNYAAFRGGAIGFNTTTGTLKVSNSEFNANYTDGVGGAINSRGISTDIDDTDFIGNYTVSGHGGAIHQHDGTGTVTIDSTTGAKFENNKAQGEGSLGGAIYVAKGSLAVNGYTFTGNEASDGGAIYLPTGVPGTINGSEFNTNKSTTYGGAIYADATTLTMEDTSFTGNESTYGGAIHSYASTLTATSCEFTSNVSANATAKGDGLGKGGAALNLVGNSVVTLNVADGEPGTFTSNVSNQWGGAIYVTDSELSIDGYTFDNNSALYAGAILFDNATETDDELCSEVITISNSTFTRNHCTNDGGAFYDNGRAVTFTNCTFGGTAEDGTDLGNYAPGLGGVIYSNGSATLNFVGTNDNALFENNKANKTGNNTYGGGAIYSNGALEISGYAFVNNVAKENGGAIYNAGANATIKNSTFDQNKAQVTTYANTNTGGGAIYNAAKNLFLEENIFTRNDSLSIGGAVTSYAAAPIVEDCTFGGYDDNGTPENTTDDIDYGNTSKDNGGALYSGGGNTLTVRAGDKPEMAIFESNSATGYGGAIGMGSGPLKVNGYTFKGNYSANTAANGGGAIRLNGNAATEIKNSVFDSNSTEGYGGAISAQSNITVDNTKFINNTATKQRGGAFYGHGSYTYTFNVTEGSELAICQGNIAAQGGAICAANGTLNVTGYTFVENKATSGVGGGAIKTNNDNITVNLTSLVFVKNEAPNGGALYFDATKGNSKAATINIKDCSFGGTAEDGTSLGNKATGNGGVIWTNDSVTINLSSTNNDLSYFANNSANQGGVIYLKGTLTGSGYTFTGNTPNNIYLDGTGANASGYTGEY